MGPLSNDGEMGEEFAKVHPKVRVDISAGGAGKGVADALASLVDIGMVSREINPEEIKHFFEDS